MKVTTCIWLSQFEANMDVPHITSELVLKIKVCHIPAVTEHLIYLTFTNE